MTPVPPLDWHPWYRDKTWLLDWLEGRSGPGYQIRIPVLGRITAVFGLTTDDLYPAVLDHREIIITRRKAAGPAPYVGRPFVYSWWVGVDNL
jgi:hypothetical protein